MCVCKKISLYAPITPQWWYGHQSQSRASQTLVTTLQVCLHSIVDKSSLYPLNYYKFSQHTTNCWCVHPGAGGSDETTISSHFYDCASKPSRQSLPEVEQRNVSGSSIIICPADSCQKIWQPAIFLGNVFPSEECHCVVVPPFSVMQRSGSRQSCAPAVLWRPARHGSVCKWDSCLWIMLMWYSTLPSGMCLTLQ